MHTYPAQLEIVPLATPPRCTVSVPGSKSITNRALVLAALSPYRTKLFNVLRSEDTEVMVDCLQRLGLYVIADWESNQLVVGRPGENDDGWVPHVAPEDERFPKRQADLFVGNSGTTIRFLTAALATTTGEYRLDGIPRMRERPIGDLIDALRQLGVSVRSEFENGCPPVILRANGLKGGHVRIRAGTSSQFLSGLMMAAPFATDDVTIEIDGPLVSEPYVQMTMAMLQEFGTQIQANESGRYRISSGSCRMRGYQIEPDASSASYFLAAAAIAGGSVAVSGLTMKSLQGDVQFLDVLEELGCNVVRGHNAIGVNGGTLRGIDVDMNAISDTVMTLAAVACFADGPTTIRNVAHIRHKETDRIAAVATELRKLGAEVDEFPDGLRITPRPLTGCAVDTYNDHRMAMSLALIGLKVPGVVIKNPGCVAKTYPKFWQDFEKLSGVNTSTG